MPKRAILLLIPLAIISGFLIYTWADILFTNDIATWRHYLAILLFIPLMILFFKDFKKSVVATGIFLLLGTCNLTTLTAAVITNAYEIRIGGANLLTPSFQPLSFVLLLLYFFMNFDTLVDIRLDFKEEKEKKKLNK